MAVKSGVWKMGKEYREDLIKQIKDAGQELIDRAEDMISENTDTIANFTIYISFPQGDILHVPEISWTTDVTCKNTLERWKKGE